MLQDWTLSYGPITIGDAEALPAVNFTNLDVMSMPEVRTNDITLIQRDGYWAGDDYMGGRTVALSLEVQGKDSDEFNEAVNLIMRAFSPGVSGESPLTFKIPGVANGREAYVNVRTRRRSAPLDARFGRLYCAFEIELFATDPLIYATEETAVTIRNGTPSGPLARVLVEGSRTAETTIDFTGVTNPRIENAFTGVGTTYTGTGTFTTAGPKYIPGERFLVLKDSGTPKTGTAVVKWRDTWV
ncbi:minor tail protein [Streptomyces phage Shady]|uniref:Minor tail protein n=1 Tax=Streptomyces phage Shady TaxID=2767585 RepID=A0A873WNY7_9CAUD|nr:minor tail protein [Streptomyces phage Shady]